MPDDPKQAKTPAVPQPAPPPGAIRQLVTPLHTVEAQVGRHVLAALGENETVAVLSTVVAGITADQVVSIPLTRQQLGSVQQLLTGIQASAQAAIEDRAIGFVRRDREGDEE